MITEFSKHSVFFDLQPDLNLVVAGWVADLTERYIYESPEEVYEDLRQIILRPQDLELTEPQLSRLRKWLDNTPIKDAVKAVAERGGWGRLPRTPPKATAQQLTIIEEAQKEVGLDFTRFFAEFTTWEADVVIKGCVAVSEVQRQTGDRHFPLRELRASLRNHIQSQSQRGFNENPPPRPFPTKIKR
jgi:hypothetical protein